MRRPPFLTKKKAKQLKLAKKMAKQHGLTVDYFLPAPKRSSNETQPRRIHPPPGPAAPDGLTHEEMTEASQAILAGTPAE